MPKISFKFPRGQWVKYPRVQWVNVTYPVLETKAGPSVRDRQLLVKTSNFLHISLQIDVWISQNFAQDQQLFQLSLEHCNLPVWLLLAGALEIRGGVGGLDANGVLVAGDVFCWKHLCTFVHVNHPLGHGVNLKMKWKKNRVIICFQFDKIFDVVIWHIPITMHTVHILVPSSL